MGPGSPVRSEGTDNRGRRTCDSAVTRSVAPGETGRPNRPGRGYWLASANTRPDCARLDQATELDGALGVASRAAMGQLNIPGMLSRPTGIADAWEATPGMPGYSGVVSAR